MVTLYNTNLFCEECGELIITRWDASRKRMVGEHCAFGDIDSRSKAEQCPNYGKLYAPPAAIEIK
jgi:hypothetical protein